LAGKKRLAVSGRGGSHATIMLLVRTSFIEGGVAVSSLNDMLDL
jgi:hypothetical protein